MINKEIIQLIWYPAQECFFRWKKKKMFPNFNVHVLIILWSLLADPMKNKSIFNKHFVQQIKCIIICLWLCETKYNTDLKRYIGRVVHFRNLYIAIIIYCVYNENTMLIHCKHVFVILFKFKLKKEKKP